MADHNELGKKGEELAVKHLKENGYKIVETNYRFKKDELDIIAEKNDSLIIVEVKTRVNEYFGRPEEFVSQGKQKRIINCANQYILEKDIESEIRFDIIAVVINSKRTSLNHIEEAFIPSP